MVNTPSSPPAERVSAVSVLSALVLFAAFAGSAAVSWLWEEQPESTDRARAEDRMRRIAFLWFLMVLILLFMVIRM